ncbi:hypothetical protein M0811_00332 [Anaeramoeba ignava]|uniref:Mitochondrial import inner membrane translocase subunit n=1 Tax=Anaeramoeba ignava TaxID=1746090 RepID=A0A9Q0LQ62_ANAIG|nr:hypothetical protein M0811_00332 [Anaeramoeba ignava]
MFSFFQSKYKNPQIEKIYKISPKEIDNFYKQMSEITTFCFKQCSYPKKKSGQLNDKEKECISNCMACYLESLKEVENQFLQIIQSLISEQLKKK